MAKRFAILVWHTKGRYSTLLGFVNADNAPHAKLKAFKKWPKVDPYSLMARHGWGPTSDPNHYTNAPKYREVS